jgi:hypothetical protein
MSTRRPAWIALVLGACTLAAVPAGIVLGWRLISADLVRSTLGAVAACFVIGFFGVAASRRARLRIELSIARRGERALRVGRVLVFSGLYVGLVGAIALGFYGVVLLYE